MVGRCVQLDDRRVWFGAHLLDELCGSGVDPCVDDAAPVFRTPRDVVGAAVHDGVVRPGFWHVVDFRTLVERAFAPMCVRLRILYRTHAWGVRGGGRRRGSFQLLGSRLEEEPLRRRRPAALLCAAQFLTGEGCGLMRERGDLLWLGAHGSGASCEEPAGCEQLRGPQVAVEHLQEPGGGGCVAADVAQHLGDQWGGWAGRAHVGGEPVHLVAVVVAPALGRVVPATL